MTGSALAVTSREKPAGGQLAKSDHHRNTSVHKIRWAVEQAKARIKDRRILHTDYRRPFRTYAKAFRALRALIFFKQAFE